MRFLDEISERFLSTQNANSEGTLHSYVTLGEGAPRGVGVIFEAPLGGIGRPGGVSGKRAASESGPAKS